jgi:CDP-diglyceride synthetase
MSVVALFHDRLSVTILLFFAVAGLWGLLEYARGNTLSGSISGALVIGQVLVVIQGALGMVLYLFGDRPDDPVHLLYGFTAALVLPFVWSYMRSRAPRQALLLYSLIALFIVGLAIRGITTGST